MAIVKKHLEREIEMGEAPNAESKDQADSTHDSTKAPGAVTAMSALFEHGSAWMRADFHMQTPADTEFIYSGDTIDISAGSIDSPPLQEAIVSIMDGGRDAFQRRKEIYQIWKRQSS